MTDYEIMLDAINRIRRKTNNPYAVSFYYDIDNSIDFFVLGELHVGFCTQEESYAFLDGFETALDVLMQK